MKSIDDEIIGMGEVPPREISMWGAIFEQFQRMLPERYRVQIVACVALMGVIAIPYFDWRVFAKESELSGVQQTLSAQITQAVAPLASAIKQDRESEDRRYIEQLSSDILQSEARCEETKDAEAKGLYRSSLSDLLERYQKIEGFPYPQQVGC